MKIVALVALSLVVGCKSKDAATAARDGGAAAVTQPALQAVGLTDPFARLTSEQKKSLDRGYKAQRAKKLDDAAAAFQEVVTAAPDYTAARAALVRTLVLAGKNADAVAAFEGLLARDYVAYQGALDTKKEFAPLRAAPEWARVGELKTAYRGAYAKGLDGGFFLVARTKPATEPQLAPGKTELALDLKQEIFHYDADGKRFRRLTDTAGHAFALARSPDGKRLAFLVAPTLGRQGGSDSFVDPQLGEIDLASLEVTGPFTAKGRFDDAALSYAKGAVTLALTDPATHLAAAWTFDTARTALARLAQVPEPDGGETRASPGHVTRSAGKAVPGVKLDGPSSLKLDGVAAPIVSSRPIEPSSLDWSPKKTRLTYAGQIDACKIARGESKEKNELFVFDVEKKSAQRVAAAVSAFETLWLDDDRLVYEGGVGKDGQLHLYSFSAHADASLPTRYGAGLYGVPTLACEAEEPTPDDDDQSEGD